MVKEEYKYKLLRALAYHFPEAKIYLYGSRARSDFTPRSDIDIAVDAGHPLDYLEIYRAEITIEHLNIPQKVDLVDFWSIPEALKKNIERDKVEWTLQNIK